MPITQAMLMAAGLGTRLKPFTDHAPKALMPILGVPAAQFAIESLARAGVEKIVANVHHHAEQARAGLVGATQKRWPPPFLGGPHLLVSDESAQLLGSAGGIKKALPKGKGYPLGDLLDNAPFFLMNADVLCDVDLVALAETHQRLRNQHGVAMTLAVAPIGPANGQYAEIFTQSNGLILKIGPKASQRPFFVGAAVFEPEAFAGVPEGVPAEAVPLVFQPAIEGGRAGFYETGGGSRIWKDIGSPQLWLDTHLEMIARLETGSMPASWRRAIEEKNERISNGVWIGRGAGRKIRQRATRWQAPCYWDSKGAAPQTLGPGAVLYGDAQKAELSAGIGFGGTWVQTSNL